MKGTVLAFQMVILVDENNFLYMPVTKTTRQNIWDFLYFDRIAVQLLAYLSLESIKIPRNSLALCFKETTITSSKACSTVQNSFIPFEIVRCIRLRSAIFFGLLSASTLMKPEVVRMRSQREW